MEYKFRAWDKIDKGFASPAYLEVFSDGTLHGVERLIIDQLIYINPEKKEFFVNDIIEFRANYSSKQCGWLTGLIVRDEFSYKIKVGDEFYSIEEETDEFYYKAKVIGNIHQNPELLK